MKNQNKELLRALMILNEVSVDAARFLSNEKFDTMQDKIDEVRQTLIDQLFPEDRNNEINWGDISKT
jgi:hypothetical protein